MDYTSVSLISKGRFREKVPSNGTTIQFIEVASTRDCLMEKALSSSLTK